MLALLLWRDATEEMLACRRAAADLFSWGLPSPARVSIRPALEELALPLASRPWARQRSACHDNKTAGRYPEGLRSRAMCSCQRSTETRAGPLHRNTTTRPQPRGPATHFAASGIIVLDIGRIRAQRGRLQDKSGRRRAKLDRIGGKWAALANLDEGGPTSA